MSDALVMELVSHQAHKIEADCDRASVRDSLVSAKWYQRNLYLGISAAALAAIAAFTAGNRGLDTHDVVFKYLIPSSALLSAIFSSILTFLAPAQKAETYHKFSNRYHSLRDRIRAFIAFKCVEGVDDEALKNEFHALLVKKQEIDADHPVVPERYYAKAVEVIERRIDRNKKLKESKRTERRSRAQEAPQGAS